MTAHRTWWDYNAHRFARVEARRWRNRHRNRRLALYSAALTLAFMLAALVTAAHAQSGDGRASRPCPGGQVLSNGWVSTYAVHCGGRQTDPTLSEPVAPGTSLRNFASAIGLDGQAGAL